MLGAGRRWAVMGLAFVALIVVAAVVPSGPAAAAPTVEISAGAGAIVEGDSGSRVLSIPVVLSAPATATVTVAYAVVPDDLAAGGTATSTDFRTRAGTLTFALNATTGRTPVQRDVAVTVFGDTVAEGDQSFVLVLSAATGPATIRDPAGIGRIVDDDVDATARVEVGDVTIPEGKAGAPHLARVPVTLSQPLPLDVSVSYTVTGTATAGVDYRAPTTRTLTIPANARERTIAVRALADSEAEAPESVTVTLTGASIARGRTQGGVTIADDPYVGLRGAPTVAAIGDSIFTYAEVAIVDALGDTYRSWLIGIPGYSIGNALPALDAQLSTDPDAVVVELGTDDVLGNISSWREEYDQLMVRIGDRSCVVIVNTSDPYADYYASISWGFWINIGADLNALIADSLATHPGMHLVDWSAAVQAHPGYVRDGLHPSDAGIGWLAAEIRLRVDECGMS